MNTLIPNGPRTSRNYRAVLTPGAVQDPSGHALATGHHLDLFILGGDANRDRKVDLQDLMILAANWQGTGKTFSQGDFNYDSIVNSADLGILAQKWQHRLDAPVVSVPVLSASVVRSASRTPARIAAQILA